MISQAFLIVAVVLFVIAAVLGLPSASGRASYGAPLVALGLAFFAASGLVT